MFSQLLNRLNLHEQKNNDDDENNNNNNNTHTIINNLEWFRLNRTEQYNTSVELRRLLLTCKCIVLYAEEKSGKRVIKEITCLMGNRLEKHYYICALSRKDVITQLEELETYGLTSICVNRRNKSNDVVIKLTIDVNNPNIQKIIIHLDECDYGSGATQNLSYITTYAKNQDKIKLIYYSATPEEALMSVRFLDDEDINHSVIRFTPNNDYRGSKWFLDHNLVDESSEFFDYPKLVNEGLLRFKPQGIEYLNSMVKYSLQNEAENKNFIGILRLTGKYDGKQLFKTFKKHVYNLTINNRTELNNVAMINELINWIFIYSDKSLKWDKQQDIKGLLVNGKINIFVIEQTCSRSTELCGYFKNHQGFYHDYRCNVLKKSYNTLSQAYGRIKHYKYAIINGRLCEVMWNGRIAIRKLVFETNCDPSKLDQFKKVADRIQSKRSKDVEVETEICQSLNEAERFIRTTINNHYRIPTNFNETHIINGVYNTIMRSIRKRSTLTEVICKKHYGINRTSKFRIHPCYDETDNSRLYFVVCYFVSIRRLNNDKYKHETKDKSIFY